MFVAGVIPLCNPTGISESDTLLLRLSLSPSSSFRHPNSNSKCCLFNSSTMRILRKPVSLCLSLFSPESSALSSFSSRIRFASAILGQSDRSHSPGKRKGIHTVGYAPLPYFHFPHFAFNFQLSTSFFNVNLWVSFMHVKLALVSSSFFLLRTGCMHVEMVLLFGINFCRVERVWLWGFVLRAQSFSLIEKLDF